MQSGK